MVGIEMAGIDMVGIKAVQGRTQQGSRRCRAVHQKTIKKQKTKTKKNYMPHLPVFQLLDLLDLSMLFVQAKSFIVVLFEEWGVVDVVGASCLRGGVQVVYAVEPTVLVAVPVASCRCLFDLPKADVCGAGGQKCECVQHMSFE